MIIMLGTPMNEASAPDWKILGALGTILLFDTIFFKISFSGPWDSESFTLGIIGLSGLSLIYISWYRLNFKMKGLIPWMDNWKNPKKTAKYVILIGIITIFAAWLTGNKIEQLPDPSGLILALIGCLMILNGTYVLLSLGILKEN
ncbi:MAG: hypothetical protein ACI9EM_000949 [Candidatus Thalassarchaeaceae archaeon]|jgi:hypothetical protein|tara:strand:- start:1496 stop:1930 length:435 start_codon:yes stop_codon:yes gene_type:complete